MNGWSRKTCFGAVLVVQLGILLTSAAAAPGLSVGVRNGEASQRLEVPVVYSKDKAVAAVQFDIEYDNKELISDRPILGSAMRDHVVWSALVAPGRRRVVIAPDAENTAIKSGEVVRLPFTVRANAPAQSRLLKVGQVVMSDGTARDVRAGVIADGMIGDPGNVSNDQDLDGMPDSWEIRYGLDPFDGTDAAADANGDGVTNLGEYRNGADPRGEMVSPVRLYLANHAGNSSVDTPRIVVVDPDSGMETAMIPMNADPQALLAHPDGSAVYAAVGADIAIIDVGSNREVNRLSEVAGAYDTVSLLEDMAISNDGLSLYVVYRKMPLATLQIKVFDISRPTEPVLHAVIDDGAFDGCYGPLGLGDSPDGGTLYVACRSVNPGQADRFFVVDIAGRSVRHTTAFTRDQSNYTFINAMTVAPDGSRVYLARVAREGSTIEIFDGGTGNRLGPIELPENALPRRSVLSPDGGTLYVMDQRLGVHVVDTSTKSIVKTISNGRSRGVDLVRNADGSRLYTTSISRVFVLDGQKNQWLSTVTGDFQHVFQLALAQGR